MTKKPLAAIYPGFSGPQFSTLVVYALLGSMTAHALHYRAPDVLLREWHIESEPAPQSLNGGRVTAWVTNTSTAAGTAVLNPPWR